MAELITDAELLDMGLALNALAGIPEAKRDTSRVSASSFVLGHLRKRFKLPLVSWSDDVKRATAHIAAYDLLVLRGFSPQAGSDVSIRDRYLAAVQWCRDVAKGDVEPEAVVDSSPDIEEASPLMASEPAQWPVYGSRRNGNGCCS